MRYIIRTAALHAALVLCWCGVSLAQVPPDGLASPAPSISHLSVNLPKAVIEDELAQYADWLALSPEQAAAVNGLFMGYRRQWRDVLDRNDGELRRLQLLASEASASPTTADSIQSRLELSKLESEVARSLGAVDMAFMNGMRATLSDPQLPGMVIVLARRQRTQCQFVDAYTNFGAVMFDPLAELKTLRVETNDYPGLRELLINHVRSVGPMAQALDDHIARNRRQQIEVGAAFSEALAAGDVRAMNAADSKELEYGAERARLERRLAEAQIAAARACAAVLPEPLNLAFADDFNRRAFHLVYPDATTPAGLLRKALRATGVTDEHRAAIEAATAGNRAEYARVLRHMENLSLERSEEWSSRRPIDANFPAYREAMRTARSSIANLNAQFVDQLQNKLPPEALDEIAPTLDKWRLNYQATLEQWSKDDYPPM